MKYMFYMIILGVVSAIALIFTGRFFFDGEVNSSPYILGLKYDSVKTSIENKGLRIIINNSSWKQGIVYLDFSVLSKPGIVIKRMEVNIFKPASKDIIKRAIFDYPKKTGNFNLDFLAKNKGFFILKINLIIENERLFLQKSFYLK